MEIQSPSSPIICTVVAMDPANIFYRVCGTCERTLADDSACPSCHFKRITSGSSDSKRVYRILFSIATDAQVIVVICFDRAAQVLFGCTADEFFNFAKFNPFAVEEASKILKGEMLKLTLSRPKSGHAQHLRVASVVPLRADFCPVIEALKKLYMAGRPQVQSHPPESFPGRPLSADLTARSSFSTISNNQRTDENPE